MSVDVIDDLEAAEDMAGRLAETLRRAVNEGGFESLRDAAAALAAWDEYCRPSCQFAEEGACQDDDPELCGCPCRHDEEPPGPCPHDPDGQHFVGCGCDF